MVTRNNILPSPSNEQDTSADDVNFLKLWVQKNQPLLDVLLDSFCVVDANNRVVDFNVAFTELCGESYRKVLKIGNFCDLVKTETCPDMCPAKQILQAKKPLRLDEVAGSSKAYPTLQMILSGVPIFHDDGRIIGSLLTIRNVSAELELQKKYEERKQESVMDGLTKIYNKKYAEQLLLKAIKGTLRDTPGLSILMCDIDHFKQVNDKYGHQAGDYVLSNVAQIAKQVARDSDIVGRFGGEEFMIVLTNTDTNGARIFAERFRTRVEGTDFTFNGKSIKVTISLGSASFAEKWVNGMNPEDSLKDLIAHADEALYFAKSNGRNQACHYDESFRQKKKAS